MRRQALSTLVVTALLLTGWVAVLQVESAKAAVPEVQPPDPCGASGQLSAALAVGGVGHVLVRILNASAAPEAGAFPEFRVLRSVDGAPPELVETFTRAQTVAEAEARLTHDGGDDIALVMDTATRIAPDPPPADVLEALDVLETPPWDMVASSLADQAWRVGWAMGLAWLDRGEGLGSGFGPDDVGHTFQYVIERSLPGDPPVVVGITQVLTYLDHPQSLKPPAEVAAKTTEDLPDFTEVVEDGVEWDKHQRRRWFHGSIALSWTLPQACGDDGVNLPWIVGFHLYRRVDSCLDQVGCPQRINPQLILPSEPHEGLDADGKPLPDPSGHVAVPSYFKDNATLGLEVGQRYCYHVRAVNLLGHEGTASVESCALAVDTTPPAPPREFRAAVESGKVVLRWRAPEGEPAARYEVWRTDRLRQELGPSLPWAPIGDSAANSGGQWTLAGDQVAFVPTEQPPGGSRNAHWYKVRAFDAAAADPEVEPGFTGNPSAFTRPLGKGLPDTTPPNTCDPPEREPPRTPGDVGPMAVKPCKTVPLPDVLFNPDPVGTGCLFLGAPIDPRYRKVVWFQGEDATGDDLHLVRVFNNTGQLVFCNPIGLPHLDEVCVKLQGEDRAGNRGPPLKEQPCHYPHFSPDPPPLEQPIITNVTKHPTLANHVLVNWTYPPHPWIDGFRLLNYHKTEPEFGFDSFEGCPMVPDDPEASPEFWLPVFPVVEDGIDPAVRQTVFDLGQEDLLVTQFWVAVVRFGFSNEIAEVARCSDPHGYAPGVELPPVFHPHHESLRWCSNPIYVKDKGVSLFWDKCTHSGPPPSPPGSTFMVYRSLQPDRGFVPITPPIPGPAYIDADAHDARYHYQVARVGNATHVDGTIVDGEVRATTPVRKASGPDDSWPPTPMSQGCLFFPQQTFKEIRFGALDRTVRMTVCSHTDPVPLGGQGTQGGPQLPPLQILPPPDKLIGDIAALVPYKISGTGLLRLDLADWGLGTRAYRFQFQDLTVLPDTPKCCKPGDSGVTARVIGGKVTDAQAAGLSFPFHVEPVGDAPGLRLRLDNLTLDIHGMNGRAWLGATEDFEWEFLGFPLHGLHLGTLALPENLAFEEVAGAEPITKTFSGACGGGPALVTRMRLTTLPLRVTPNGKVVVSHDAIEPMGPLKACSQYRDPFTGVRKPPTSRLHVDTNDAFLRPVYSDGDLAFTPKGAVIQGLATQGPLSWVTSAPLGLWVDAQGGATVDIDRGRIAGGSVGGPFQVRMAHKVGNGLDGASPTWQDHAFTFDGDLEVRDGGAMLAAGGSRFAPWSLAVRWSNGGFQMHDEAQGSWTVALAPVQSRGTVAKAQFSDDNHNGMDLMGAEAPLPAEANVEPGLNHFATVDAPTFVRWQCLGSPPPPTVFKASINAYLRQSGFSQDVFAILDPNAFPALKVRGYDATLLRFAVAFLDSREEQSKTAIRLSLPYPADFEVVLNNVQIHPETACILGGDVPPGQDIVADAWNLPLEPDLGVFRGQEPVPPHGHVAACGGECPEDYPHYAFWLLGAAGLPHVEDTKFAPGPGLVLLDTAWEPSGQTLDTSVASAVLRVDGHYFTASDIRLGKASTAKGGLTAAHEHPGAGWTNGNLGQPPCAGTGADPCPPFLRYEGFLSLPYWAQSEKPVRLTAFAEGAALPKAGSPAMAMDHFLGVRGDGGAPNFLRGWTEGSGVPDLRGALRYAQKPEAQDALDRVRGLFVSVVKDHPTGGDGDVMGMDYGSVVDTFEPFLGDAGEEPSIEALTGMAARLGALRAVLDLRGIDPTTPEGLAKARDLAEQMGLDVSLDPQVSDDLEVLLELWDTWNALQQCDSPKACYVAAKGLLDQEIEKRKQQAFDALGDAVLDGPLGQLAEKAGKIRDLLKSWKINIGEMRAQIIWAKADSGPDVKTPFGDFTFQRIEIEIKMNENSKNKFFSAEKLLFTLDREGVLSADAEGIKLGSKVQGVAPESVDFNARIDLTAPRRFDGGVSVYQMKLGTFVIDFIHGAFGAGAADADPGPGVKIEPFFYFGVNGQGHEEGGSVALGIGLLLGTIDEITKPTLKKSGFAELVDYLDEGDAGEQAILGIYTRGYADVKLWSSGIFEFNGGVEAAFWLFTSKANPGLDNMVLGTKFRVFVHGNVLKIVHVRADFAMVLQLSTSYHPQQGQENVELTLLGKMHGWFAGGIGWCAPGSWSSWDTRWWNDNWCVMCGISLTVQLTIKVNVGKKGVGDSSKGFLEDTDWDFKGEGDCGIG